MIASHHHSCYQHKYSLTTVPQYDKCKICIILGDFRAPFSTKSSISVKKLVLYFIFKFYLVLPVNNVYQWFLLVNHWSGKLSKIATLMASFQPKKGRKMSHKGPYIREVGKIFRIFYPLPLR